MGKQAQTRRERKEDLVRRRQEVVKFIAKTRSPWENAWRRFDLWIFIFCLMAISAFPFIKKDSLAIGDQAVLHTTKGDIEIEFYEEAAPKTVQNFALLAERKFFNNMSWHRVIKDFIIQSGDPKGDGTGGESAWGNYFEDEINPTVLGVSSDQIKKNEEKGYKYNYSLKSHKMEKGSVAMANAGPNTNGSQFFIVTDKEQPYLNGIHTVFAHVTKGMEVVRAISEAPVDDKDKPQEPIYISSVELK